MSIKGAAEEPISVAEGDGYSKVVKRTVLKSEGDHTEVCILYIICLFIVIFFEKLFSTENIGISVVVHEKQLNDNNLFFYLGNIC